MDLTDKEILHITRDLTDEEIRQLIRDVDVPPNKIASPVSDNNNALGAIGLPSFIGSINFFEACRILLNAANKLNDEDLVCRIVQTKMLHGERIIYRLLQALRSYRTSHVSESNANDPTPIQTPDPIG